VQVRGLKPGEHGFHIHAVGKCDPPAFTSAGAHFNPYGKSTVIRIPRALTLETCRISRWGPMGRVPST